MGHNIDLSKYKIRTDLAIEAIDDDCDGITCHTYSEGNIKITDVVIDDKACKKIGKKSGNYVTIEFEDVTDHENFIMVEDVFSKQLETIIKKVGMDVDKTCLVVGLGNENSTPDALGPKVVSNILVTRHLFMLGSIEEGYKCVSAIAPGVLGQTGLETSEIVKCIVDEFKPDFVIVVDALASQSVERVNKTIQMTDTGIHPGSGVGNSRKEISFRTLNVPCIAIGIPTVVDAVTIVSDTIDYMYKHYVYSKDKNPLNKLIIKPQYDKIEVNSDDREQLFGMIGKLNNEEIKQLIFEVLSPIGYNLMVTVKEVDYLIDKLSLLISNGIDKALHKKVK